MRPELFDFFKSELQRRSGIKLSNEKLYLIESRLDNISKESGFSDVQTYIESLKTTNNNDAHWRQVVEAMTTNETFFFRDKTPFDSLKLTILPHLLDNKNSNETIRIWSAACSTGQEPYSIGIIIDEMKDLLNGRRVEIVGTDINDTVIDKAKQGLYSQFEVQRGLPIQQVVKYFEKKNDLWQINSNLRNMVKYKKLNLLDNYSLLGKFDIVFCRNVLIYFDVDTKRVILDKINSVLKPDGYLLLGASETTIGVTDEFKSHSERRGLFVKKHFTQNAGRPQSPASGERPTINPTSTTALRTPFPGAKPSSTLKTTSFSTTRTTNLFK